MWGVRGKLMTTLCAKRHHLCMVASWETSLDDMHILKPGELHAVMQCNLVYNIQIVDIEQRIEVAQLMRVCCQGCPLESRSACGCIRLRYKSTEFDHSDKANFR